MSRLQKILLSQNSLAKTLGFNKFVSAIKFDHHVEILKTIEAKSVLVLAPHPDDEVFGLGGTLAKLSKNKSKIVVAYFCDGSGGVVEETDHYKEDPSNKYVDLAEVRKEEARKSAKILGIGKQIFFDYRDNKLDGVASAVKATEDLITLHKPDIVFVPSFLDNHQDHKAVSEILAKSLNSSTMLGSLEIWSYEIWTPIFPNRIVDINATIERKKKAILAHVSQLKSRDYEKAILGLNQYRAEINGVKGLAEAFFATTPEIYKKLYQKS